MEKVFTMTFKKKLATLVIMGFCLQTVASPSLKIQNFHSATPIMTDQSQEQLLFETVFTTIKTSEQISFILALTGVSTDTIRIIHNDLTKALNGNNRLPNIVLKTGQVYWANKATGIKITSYAPLIISYRGEFWSTHNSLTADQNYFALQKFLNPKTKSSVLSIFIPTSHADTKNKIDLKNELEILAVISAFAASAMATKYSVDLAVTSASAIIFAGAVIGGLSSYIDKWKNTATDKEKAKTVDKMMTGDFTLKCAADHIDITMNAKNDKSAIHLTRLPNSYSIKIYDQHNNDISETLTRIQQNSIYEMTQGCRTEKDAEKITKSIRTANQRISEAIANPKSINQKNQNYPLSH